MSDLQDRKTGFPKGVSLGADDLTRGGAGPGEAHHNGTHNQRLGPQATAAMINDGFT